MAAIDAERFLEAAQFSLLQLRQTSTRMLKMDLSSKAAGERQIPEAYPQWYVEDIVNSRGETKLPASRYDRVLHKPIPNLN